VCIQEGWQSALSGNPIDLCTCCCAVVVVCSSGLQPHCDPLAAPRSFLCSVKHGRFPSEWIHQELLLLQALHHLVSALCCMMHCQWLCCSVGNQRPPVHFAHLLFALHCFVNAITRRCLPGHCLTVLIAGVQANAGRCALICFACLFCQGRQCGRGIRIGVWLGSLCCSAGSLNCMLCGLMQ
jgi:hypothetical protein